MRDEPRATTGTPPASDSGLVTLEDGEYYRIVAYDRLPPFFITVVSAGDHWMFASSRGGLTAGRRDPDSALFPYTTDDRVHDAAGVTGSLTVLLVERGAERVRWEPFAALPDERFETRRAIYKSVEGDRLVYEERNLDLALGFRYAWGMSRRYGFVRRVTLENRSEQPVRVRLLDGIANLLPSGVERGMQMEYSTLVDAYKRSELVHERRFALHVLASIPVDRAEPCESLRATVTWLSGLEGARCLLSPAQVEAFRRGEQVAEEQEVRGSRQAFLVTAEIELPARDSQEWTIVADVDQEAGQVEELLLALESGDDLARELELDVREGSQELRRLVGSADGAQVCGRPLEDVRHYANTLFNVMRGGVFQHGYDVFAHELLAHVENASRHVAERCASALAKLPPRLGLAQLQELVAALDDDDLSRIVREYLPLYFSRRHGDPSRPWNSFSIETCARDGTPRLQYEGNWRDIFQNWEALCASYPLYTVNVVARFVNASTPDGYNPYRLTHLGFDWEVLEPHNPWSNIGYWGDHQLVYLGRLLELAERHVPGSLCALLARRQFAYADVPYRIKPFAALLEDPHHTIEYDDECASHVERRVLAEGQDGKLARDRAGQVHRVGLAEKLVLPALVKLSNLVPDLGVWMNTQRPEWNDANNALVGFGCSVVTLCQLHRYLEVLGHLARSASGADAPVSVEVATLLRSLRDALEEHGGHLDEDLTARTRREVLNALGAAGEDHRNSVYAGFCGDMVDVPVEEIASFCDLARVWTARSIRANRRADGLYHAYNLLELDADGGLTGRRLDLMLEGQVAVLGSRLLAASEALEVLEALRRSELYRADQRSYLLYPDRPRPGFLERNRVPGERVREGGLLRALLDVGDESVVARGPGGVVRFCAAMRNGAALGRALDELPSERWATLVARDREEVLACYEEVFRHRSFTGRSGSFYGYEGLGCVYWHQVSKLLLAVFEAIRDAVDADEDARVVRQLAARYAEVRAGLGVHKRPEEHGAFPTDPYSHTPGRGGAEQPGMTGQVKEDYLTRFGELGAWTSGGRLRFHPALLDPADWLSAPSTLRYIAADGRERSLLVEPGALAFTHCQVPIVLRRADVAQIRVLLASGAERVVPDLVLDAETSAAIFGRTGAVVGLEVRWPGSLLLEEGGDDGGRNAS